MEKQCVQCIISGRVQGVGYRATAMLMANKFGVTGWVRNLPDGTVEALICGNNEQVKAMTEWLWQGPFAAKVTNVASKAVSWQEHGGFEAR